MNYYKLTALYYYIYEYYNAEPCWHCQRFSNNSKPNFIDEEILTIYIFFIVEEEKFKIKSIYNFTRRYLHSRFPKLPSYQAFCNRLNRLASILPVLAACFLRDINHLGARLDISLLDWMPIITCAGKRAGKVAP